ncbi:hypothetical protein FACS1894111_07730 [Clostridia bacterium]|nr:hypothetical protein FACS1894111_07730 [Clostridia bacterium]
MDLSWGGVPFDELFLLYVQKKCGILTRNVFLPDSNRLSEGEYKNYEQTTHYKP